MSYVVNGLTYDEAGYQIDAFGRRLGGRDANVAIDQPLSSTAATARATVGAVLQSRQAAAAHPSATTRAPVMPTAPRVNVAAPARSSSLLGSPLVLLALAAGAYYFYKYG